MQSYALPTSLLWFFLMCFDRRGTRHCVILLCVSKAFWISFNTSFMTTIRPKNPTTCAFQNGGILANKSIKSPKISLWTKCRQAQALEVLYRTVLIILHFKREKLEGSPHSQKSVYTLPEIFPKSLQISQTKILKSLKYWGEKWKKSSKNFGSLDISFNESSEILRNSFKPSKISTIFLVQIFWRNYKKILQILKMCRETFLKETDVLNRSSFWEISHSQKSTHTSQKPPNNIWNSLKIFH